MLILLIHLSFSQNITCLDGQIIDQSTNQCIYCPDKQGILQNGICGICPRFEGINRITGYCNKCAENECIDPKSRRLLSLEFGNYIKNETTNECTCKNSYGFDSYGVCQKCLENQGTNESGVCIRCKAKMGIDPLTGRCRKCPNGHGIDILTKKCTECPEGAYIDPKTNICTCPTGQGIDPDNYKCIKCKDGMHINSATYRCHICDKTLVVDETTDTCYKCQSHEGIDPETHKCKSLKGTSLCKNLTTYLIQEYPKGSHRDDNFFCTCSDGKGFLEDGTCGYCESGYIIDRKTQKCIKCKHIASKGKCIDCSELNKEFDEETQTCIECQSEHCFDPFRKKCIPAEGTYSHSKCSCKRNFYFNFDNNRCEEYPNKTNQCILYNSTYSIDYWADIPEDYCRDPTDNKCYRIILGWIKDPLTGNCTRCNEGMGYDPQLKACVECDYDKCIDIEGACRYTKDNEYKDPITKKCECKPGNCLSGRYCYETIKNHGFDPETKECTNCPFGCIDPETLECRKPQNEGIDLKTRHCIKCPHSSIAANNTCICQNGRVYNNITGKCVKCNAGEGFNHATKKCGICQIGEGILPSNECGICPEGQGIDKETKKCIVCPDDQGILPESNICDKCPENSSIDKDSKKCLCNKGFIITDSGTCEECPFGTTSKGKPDDGYCGKCEEDFCLNQITKECESYTNDDSKGIDPDSGICVQCPEGSSKISGHCKCNDENKGFDSDYSQCRVCNEDEEMNQFGKCKKCNLSECLDSTKKCVPMGSTLFKNKENGQCETECNENFNPYLRICGVCPEGSNECLCKENEAFIDIDDAIHCGVCPNFYGIDPETRRCTKCQNYNCILNGECIHTQYGRYASSNGTCVDHCQQGEIVDYSSYTCVKCGPNKCIDRRYEICRNPYENEAIEPETLLCTCPLGDYIEYNACTKCPLGNCINKGGICESLGSDLYDYKNRSCIQYSDCRSSNKISSTCGYCPEGSSGVICRCDAKNHYLVDADTCGYCSLGYGIDNDRSICQKCDFQKGIDSSVRKCYEPKIQEGIDIDTGFLINCNKDQCIDENTLECIPIPINQGVSPQTGKCVNCLYPQVIDPETKNCICPPGQGYDKNYLSCQICEFGIDPIHNNCTNCLDTNDGIDHETRKCRKCNDDEGIDPETLECTKCINGKIRDYDTPFCKCPPLQGFDIETNKCGKCKEGEGIDIESNKCMKCPTGLTIDPLTLECKQCPQGQGIDNSTGLCRICPEKQGINPITKICQQCNEGEGINGVTGICQICTEDQYLDNSTLKCICNGANYLNEKGICEECYHVLNYDKTKCYSCKSYNLVYDDKTDDCKKCPLQQALSLPYKNLCKLSSGEQDCIYDNVWQNMENVSELFREEETYFCFCSPGFGIIIFNETIQCKKCNEGEGIDQNTKSCRKCDNDNGEAIDPITKVCRKCDEEEAIDHVNLTCIKSPIGSQKVNNFWECSDGKGLDSTSENCIECPADSQYVHEYSGKCSSCSGEHQVINNDSKSCTCETKYGLDYSEKCIKCQDSGKGIDSFNHHCRECNFAEREGIDPTTGFCVKCKNDEIISTKGECQKCPSGTGVDHLLNTCKCPFGRGLDETTSKCISCQTLGMGIDVNTRKCVKCETNYGIDENTGFCTKCDYGCINPITGIIRKISIGYDHDRDTDMCYCLDGFSLDKKTGLCHLCPIDQGVDPVTGECRVCNEGEGIHSWTFKCQKCEEGYGITTDHNRCGRCSKGEGIDPITGKCGPCKKGQGIDPATKKCRECLKGQIIDSETQMCVCPDKQCIDHEKQECIVSPIGQAINKTSGECVVCPDDQGIDRITRQCTICGKGQTKQDKTNLCTCETGLGFDPDYEMCVVCRKAYIINEETNLCEKCPVGEGVDPENPNKCRKCDGKNHEGIDPVTKMCTICKDDQGIDTLTGECVYCPDGSIINVTKFECQCGARQAIDDASWMCVSCFTGEGIDTVTKRCMKCPNGYGTDTVTGQCVQCKPDQGINPQTGACTKCSYGQGIDPITRKCVKCSFGYGVLSDTFECGICPSGLGINSESGYCEKCKASEVMNLITRICEKCNGVGFGFDQANNECKRCSVENCFNCTANFNVCIACLDTYQLKDGKCEKIIDIVTPTEIPGIVDADVTINEDTGKLEIKETEEIKNNPCKVKVESQYNGKTLAIDDVGQKLTQISFDDSIKEIIIEQNTNKQLDILIENTQPIKITIKNPKSTNIKGKGELNIQNQQSDKPVSLDSIAPSFNEKLVINSNSQINAKKLDIYGKSIVEFENADGALIETVAVQQKATTTLENVEIKEKLIAGIQSSITIGEKVKISGAQFELSNSNEVQNEAVIKGKLSEKPSKISIRDRNNNEILENKNEFIIAESSNADFKCNDWAGTFDTKANSKYNQALCSTNENSKVTRLIASHNEKNKKKGGLKPGVIAAIVIVVVVVVAAVIILLWFFVFRKKNSYSQDENSLSGNKSDEI